MTLTENSSVVAIDTQRPQKYPHHQIIAAGTHFYAQRGTKTILVFLPADGEASWSLLPSSVKDAQ